MLRSLLLRGERRNISDARFEMLTTLACVFADALDNLRLVGEAHTEKDK